MFNILFCNVEGITTPRKSVACFIVIIYLIFIKHFQFNKIGRSIQIITSHRISPKRQEPRAKLRKDLHRQLRTAVYDLISDAKRYDSGEFDAIRRSSVTIRTLLYDHKNTHGHNSLSILSQLGLKDSMKFATYFKKSYSDSHADYSYFKTARFDVPDFVTPSKRYYDTYLFAPNYIYEPDYWLPFKKWWTSRLITLDFIEEQFSLTRQNIIMTEANQDGGAHFDSELQPYYRWLRDGATGSTIQNIYDEKLYKGLCGGNIKALKDEDYIFKPRDINLAMTRQIVHETLLSLMQLHHLTFKINYNPDFLHNINSRLNYAFIQIGLRK